MAKDMYEIEVKVRADHDHVRGRLVTRNASRLGRVVQEDTYYSHPDRNFADTDEALRIRREHADEKTTARVTYKGPLVDAESKTREEFETDIENGETMGQILERLGYDPVSTVHKERERYEYEGYDIMLDIVKGLGEFVEVETTAPKASLEEKRKSAMEILERLGLDPDDQQRTSYLELLLESNG